MKRFTLVVLLIALCFLGNGIAETEAIRGKIDMNMLYAPTPTFEISLDISIVNLFIEFTENLFDKEIEKGSEYAEYDEMIEGVLIRSYDNESGDLTKIKNHYQEILKTEKWEHIVKVKDELRVSLLYAETPGVVNGIFVSFNDKQNTTFVNVYGEIDFQKLGILFGKILESNPEFLKDIKIDGKFGIKK